MPMEVNDSFGCLSLFSVLQGHRDNDSFGEAFINSSDGRDMDNFIDQTIGSVYSNSNYTSSESAYELAQNVVDVSKIIVIPIICVFGVVGNVLILLIFLRRLRQSNVNAIEKGTIIGLMALEFSDLAYCLISSVGSLVPSQILFTHTNFSYYYQLYAPVLQNIFMKTSTWLTTIVGFGRYAVVCQPFARQLIRMYHLKIAIACTFLFSFLIHIPLLWVHEVRTLNCGTISLYTLDIGLFVKHVTLNNTFTYLWAILGYIIPVCILGYCNVCLIVSLRQSMKLHSRLRVHSRSSDAHEQITVTLVIVVLMFIVLVSPSEILHLCPSTGPTYVVAMVITLWHLKSIYHLIFGKCVLLYIVL